MAAPWYGAALRERRDSLTGARTKNTKVQKGITVTRLKKHRHEYGRNLKEKGKQKSISTRKAVDTARGGGGWYSSHGLQQIGVGIGTGRVEMSS